MPIPLPLRVCTQCGFTYAEFQARGLLGCPQCYAGFGDLLWADLLQLHPGLYRFPAPTVALSAVDSESGGNGEELAQLREMLADALREERYEAAAALRLRIQAQEGRHGSG